MLEICNRCKLVIKEKIFNAKTAIFSGNMRVLVNWGICSKAMFYGLFFLGGGDLLLSLLPFFSGVFQ